MSKMQEERAKAVQTAREWVMSPEGAAAIRKAMEEASAICKEMAKARAISWEELNRPVTDLRIRANP